MNVTGCHENLYHHITVVSTVLVKHNMSFFKMKWEHTTPLYSLLFGIRLMGLDQKMIGKHCRMK
ncbi:hypothetical protein HZS_6080 [Henneguya salminicola]|nr:hypothetical protein HZS_6080 [Henneguya salminicola]